MNRNKNVHFGPAYQCSNAPFYNHEEGANYYEDESSDIFQNSVLPPLQQGQDDPWHNFGEDAFHDTQDSAINPSHNENGLANPASESADTSDLPLDSQADQPVDKPVRTNEALTLYDPSYIEIINDARAKRKIALTSRIRPRPVSIYNVNLPLTNQTDQPIVNPAHLNYAPTLTVPLSTDKENSTANSAYDCDLSQINKANALLTNPAYNSDVSTLAGQSALSSNASDNGNPVFQSTYNYYLYLTNQNNQPMAASLYSNQPMANQVYSNQPMVNQGYCHQPMANQVYYNQPMANQVFVHQPIANQVYNNQQISASVCSNQPMANQATQPAQPTPLSFTAAYRFAFFSIFCCLFTGIIAYSFAAAGEHSECRQEAKVWLGASFITSAISIIVGITGIALIIYFGTLSYK